MSATTLRWSSCELTAHSPQPAWASAALCCEISVNRAVGVKQIWPVSCHECRLRGLAARLVTMTVMSNHTVALQIPIAT